jgi:hypothetical protein
MMEDCGAIILCNTPTLHPLHTLHFGTEQNVAIAIGHAKEGQTPSEKPLLVCVY